MPLWIAENPSTLYLLLAVAALALAIMLWIRQERKWLYALGGVAALAALVALLDSLIVTDFERIQLHVKDMADSVAKKDVDRIFSHISDGFQKGGATKKVFRGWVEGRIKNGDITELIVWEFERGDISKEKKQGTVMFLVKGRGPHFDSKFLRCIATFKLEGDGQWRMTTFDLIDPLKDPAKGDKVDIPYLQQ